MAVRRTELGDVLLPVGRSGRFAWPVRVPLRSCEVGLVAAIALAVAVTAAAAALRAIGVPWPNNTFGGMALTVGVTLWRDSRHGQALAHPRRRRIRRRRGG